MVSSILAVLFWFIGVVRGIVVVPTLDDDAIEDETRKQARKKLKVSTVNTGGKRAIKKLKMSIVNTEG